MIQNTKLSDAKDLYAYSAMHCNVSNLEYANSCMQSTKRPILKTKGKVTQPPPFLKKVVERNQPQVQVIGIACTKTA